MLIVVLAKDLSVFNVIGSGYQQGGFAPERPTSSGILTLLSFILVFIFSGL